MHFVTVSELINAPAVLEEIGLRGGSRVADLGCGATGHFVLPAARMVGESGVAYAVDIQKNVLDALRNRLEAAGILNVEFLWGDIERIGGVGIPDGTLDVALVINNLFLAKDRATLGREALRMLRSGGELVVIDWKPAASPLGPAPQSRVAPTDARNVLEQCGFRFVRVFVPGAYHYGLIFEKL